MKVSVYIDEDGRLSVMVQASPGRGRAPTVLPVVTHKDIKEKVLAVVEEMRRPKKAARFDL